MSDSLSAQIEDLQKKIEEYSKLIGDKIRSNQASDDNDPELLQLKEKLEEPTQDDKKKKKKKTSKRRKNDHWFEFNNVQIYNGMGVKGELELYFNATQILKSKLEELKKTKENVDSIIEKGLKSDLACIALQVDGMPYQISFQKSVIKRKNFSFKSTFSAKPEVIEI